MFTEDLTGAEDCIEAAVRGFGRGVCTRPESVSAMARLGRILRFGHALMSDLAKEIDDTQAYADHGARSAAELCARLTGSATGELQRVIENSHRLESLPGTDAAFHAGELSSQEVALISAVGVLDPSLETELLGSAGKGLVPLRDACVSLQARTEDPDARSKRHHAARSLRMWTAPDGMVGGMFKLPPDVGARVKAMLDKKTDGIFRAKTREGAREDHDRYAADALVELITGPSTGRVGTTVHIVIDRAALVRGHARDDERCEIPGTGPLSVSQVREELGEAFVTAIIKNGKDVTTVAHLGRHIPAELRTAMIVGGRVCCVEDCNARGYLEIDHSEVDFAQGGPAAMWNLGWLCSKDHRRKSQGWTLGPRDPDTGKRILAPPGRSSPEPIGKRRPEIGHAARMARAKVLLGGEARPEVPGEVP